MFGTVAEMEGSERDGPYLVVCEHASRRIPEGLGNLGLEPRALESHIAWDIGALGVARELARQLDAPLMRGGVSRLVYDLNRPPEAPDAIPEQSETFAIPGNRGLSQEARAARIAGIFRPFRTALGTAIAERPGLSALVTVHSFTPIWFGVPRDVEIGIVHGRDSRLAIEMLEAARRAAPGRRIELNAPYGPQDGVTHTLDQHGAGNGLRSVMLEIRNDLVADPATHPETARKIAGWLQTAASAITRDAAT